MATRTSVTCDRCSARILNDRLLLAVETGTLRRHSPEIDLCGTCAEAFGVWLDVNNFTAAPTEGPLSRRVAELSDAMAVCS